jgi:hypothetical protein
MCLISAEILCHLSHPVAVLLDQERNPLLGNLPATVLPSQDLYGYFRLAGDCLKSLFDGLLAFALCYLSSLPAYLFAKLCVSQKALVFHRVVLFVVVSLIPPRTNLS